MTNDLTTLTNERAINNALKNLIMTLPTEVVFNRDVGSTVTGFLFDFVDEGTGGILTDEIVRVIRYSEPRVELDFDEGYEPVVVKPRPEQNNFEVTITYRIVGYEQVFVVSQILEPTR